MLVNAASGNVQVNINFVETLKELSPVEAAILDVNYDNSLLKEPDFEKRKQMLFDREKIRIIFNLSREEIDLIIEHLYSLFLCHSPGSEGMKFGVARVALTTTELFEFTRLGSALVEVCREPGKTKSPITNQS